MERTALQQITDLVVDAYGQAEHTGAAAEAWRLYNAVRREAAQTADSLGATYFEAGQREIGEAIQLLAADLFRTDES